ncbi:CoA transferase [Jannaschia seohaensis]|uniref:2-methylfumaryl-CoA isomerase n=1 Tax=Jannaschia seohaensis TaxID=475081 RepID=A0A2Y9AKW0_9RHOB|nr:CoA transferase [Jannaschia seohaensis]PWJ20590.1 2-methylfumaryl-CoA isomerase [Jannaschia seohaensis]SSA44686.1 2-methylfumaryl-CoA isomerase [Jannaschia seohaensis]
MSAATASPSAGPLGGLRIVESTAFIAAPLATMSLAGLGAEVIRLDPPGGGLDYTRWPLSEEGASLYWTMLNRGKRSVTLDLREEAGREAAARLICEGDGIFVTNLPARGALAPEALLERRKDAIVVTLDGSPDGATAIDYTVHAACGAAIMAGPEAFDAPVNNAVPFWDVIAGRSLAMGLLAAELERRRTGRGQHIALSLSDIAMEAVANVGILPEAELTGQARARQGNWIYGSFGRDFSTACGRRFMLAVVTGKQWRALLEATRLGAAMERIGEAFGTALDDDTGRYRARHAIAALVQDWAGARDLAAVARAFEGTAVCWSPYRDARQMLDEDPRASTSNPLFERIAHPGVAPVLTPRAPFRMTGHPDLPARPAPALGADTAAVLSENEGTEK